MSLELRSAAENVVSSFRKAPSSVLFRCHHHTDSGFPLRLDFSHHVTNSRGNNGTAMPIDILIYPSGPYISSELHADEHTELSRAHLSSGSYFRHLLTGSRSFHCETSVPLPGDLSSTSSSTIGEMSALHLMMVSIASRQWLVCQSKTALFNLLLPT